MSAYLFTGSITQIRGKSSCGSSGCSDAVQVSDSCLSLIIHGGSVEAAQSGFEEWLRRYGDVNLISTTIKKVIAAPMTDQLITESGCVPIEWAKISEQVLASLDGLAVDDFEQGYWVDANQVIGPDNLSPDINSLQRDLEEDISSGLNWAVEKQFFFLLSVLSPPPPPREFTDEPEIDPDNPAGDGESYEGEMEEAEAGDTLFPELVNKEGAVLIQARNSAVAAWLWRRHAAGTRLAGNQIRVDSWCGAVELKPNTATASSASS